MADSDVNRKPFVVEPFNLQFKPGIDQNKLNQLLDELEVEAYLEKFPREISNSDKPVAT